MVLPIPTQVTPTARHGNISVPKLQKQLQGHLGTYTQETPQRLVYGTTTAANWANTLLTLSTAGRSAHGIAAHRSKIHGVIGAHRTSTGRRNRTVVVAIPPRAQTFSPELQVAQLAVQPPGSPTEANRPLHRVGNIEALRQRLRRLQQQQETQSPQQQLQQSRWNPANKRKRRRSISPDQRVVRAQTTGQEPTRRPIRTRACSESSAGSVCSLPDLETLVTTTTTELDHNNTPCGLGGYISPDEMPESTIPDSEASDAFEPSTPPSGQPNLAEEADLTGDFSLPEPIRSSVAGPDEHELHHAGVLKPLLEKASVQALIAYSKTPVPEERLHARQAAVFIETSERTAEAFLRNPTAKTLLHLLLLPRILGLGLKRGKLAATLRAYPNTMPEPDPPDDDSYKGSQTPVQKATKLLQKGFVGKASRSLLDPTPTAQLSNRTMVTLRQKHPIGAANPFGTHKQPTPGQPITTEAVAAAIATVGKEKAPGLSGWTRYLLDLATNSAENKLISALRLLADQIRQGKAPAPHLLCAARLVALQKEDGGIRPIAVGDILYRVAMKAILAINFRSDMLLPIQLGVGNPGGVEPAVALLQEAIAGPNKDEIQSVTSLDLSNAFNAITRQCIASSIAQHAPVFYRAAAWAYGKPSLLVLENGATIASAEGVRQGDPLAGFFFSLGIRPTLEALQAKIPQAKLISYFDDIYALNPGPESPLTAAIEVLEDSPVTLNVAKSNEYTVQQLQSQGLKALGTLIGPLQARRTFLQGKIEVLGAALDTLRQLPKQHALLLLRGSVQMLLRHLLRQLDPTGLLDLWKTADSLIQGCVQALASRAPTGYPEPVEIIHKALIALPARQGGLGLPLHEDLAVQLYQSAQHKAAEQLKTCYPRQKRQESPETQTPTAQEVLQQANTQHQKQLEQDLDQLQYRAWEENCAYLGRKWLGTLPTSKGACFEDPEATEAIRSRLLLPVRPIGSLCSYCATEAQIGHEDTCKGASRRWIARHDQITRAFNKSLSCRASLEVELEPLLPVPADHASDSLRADFAATLGNTRIYYDVQVVAINKPSAKPEALATLQEAAAEKQRKYSAIGHCFKPLIFSSGGLMEKETAQAYKALQHLIGPVAANWLDTQISYTLAKTRAVSAASIARSVPRIRT